jgi:hypothetical protein
VDAVGHSWAILEGERDGRNSNPNRPLPVVCAIDFGGAGFLLRIDLGALELKRRIPTPARSLDKDTKMAGHLCTAQPGFRELPDCRTPLAFGPIQLHPFDVRVGPWRTLFFG